jgi:hypothetical protein
MVPYREKRITDMGIPKKGWQAIQEKSLYRRGFGRILDN